jgi:hypothetical protein
LWDFPFPLSSFVRRVCVEKAELVVAAKKKKITLGNGISNLEKGSKTGGRQDAREKS